MGIENVKGVLNRIDGISNKSAGIKQYQTNQAKGTESFGDLLKNAITEVDSIQKDANSKIENIVLGKGGTPHDAMIALEKADIAFQLLNQVRGKIVRAYEEVMRTQV